MPIAIATANASTLVSLTNRSASFGSADYTGMTIQVNVTTEAGKDDPLPGMGPAERPATDGVLSGPCSSQQASEAPSEGDSQNADPRRISPSL